MEVLYAELNEWAEAATGSYSVTGDFLQYIYSVPVTKNHWNIQSRCLVHEFTFTDIFNDINHGYRAAILKKNYLWLLPLYMVVATYFNYEIYFRLRLRFILLVQMKKVISMNYGSSASSWKPWRWVRLDLTFYMRDIYINSNLSPFTKFTKAAEVPSLKISSHGTSLKWSRRPSQSAQE